MYWQKRAPPQRADAKITPNGVVNLAKASTLSSVYA